MSETTRTRALVLGGGGPVGVAWELGLASGLAAGGIDLTGADLVVGTSAGSIAGALLSSGHDTAELVAGVESLFSSGIGQSGVDQVDQEAAARFIDMTFDAATLTDDAARQEHLLEVGRFAEGAHTVPEDAFVGSIGSVLGGLPWPSNFHCTAVETDTGVFKVWGADDEVPLERAVASSCAVPGIYPPITIGGTRWADGGVRSALNADVATGFDVAIIVSVTLLELPPGMDDPRISAYLAQQRAEIDRVRASGTDVEVIVPDAEFLMISGLGMNLMDFTVVGAAAEAGARLGKLEAERFRDHWR